MAQQTQAASRNNAFGDRGFRRTDRVLQCLFAAFKFRFRRRANANYRDAAGELCYALFKFLAVVIGCRLFELLAKVLAAGLDSFFASRAADDRRCVFIDHDPLSPPQVVERDGLKLLTQFLGQVLTFWSVWRYLP